MNFRRDPMEYLNIAINLLIAFKYLQVWIHPAGASGETILSLGTLMGFEFIMVHSGVMMAAVPRKISLFLLSRSMDCSPWLLMPPCRTIRFCGFI